MNKPQNANAMAGALERHYPVTVVMKKVWRQHRQWGYTTWVVSGVLPEDFPDNCYEDRGVLSRGALSRSVLTDGDGVENIFKQGCQRLADEEGNEHFIWPGLTLSLYRDGLTSYFQNLSSDQPYLFVLCRDDDDQSALEPFLVSADFADAEAHMETEGTVLTVPLNFPFDKRIADYVLQNRPYLEKQAYEGKKHKRNRATTRL
ncbi:MAG: DUF3305 domain-containing protein [Gammaproteobacteria bacterium]|jgi:hypothetical protein